MRQAFRRAAFEQPQVNLTPLIDVVFVILIMFIVVAPLLELNEVQLAEGPHTGTHTANQKSPITIRVRKDNALFLNDQPVSLKVLTETLVLAKKQHPEAVPQIFHDRTAHFGTYQGIKNAMEGAGFSEVEVILSPAGVS